MGVFQLYVEDAMGDRVWIDNPYCKSFVDNVTTAFGTKHPPKLLLAVETWTLTNRDTSSPLTINTNDDDESEFNEIFTFRSHVIFHTHSRSSRTQANRRKLERQAIS